MTKQNNTIFWVVGILVVVVLLVGPQLGLFSISGGSMTRNVPSTVQPGQKFSVVYSTSVSGQWGASIIDDVSGGCKFPDGSNQIKTVMLSVDGSSKTVQVTAPSSGSCTFSGDYKFGTEAVKDFSDKTITISTEDDGNGDGNGNGDNGVNGDGNGINGNGDNGEENGEENGEIPSFSLNQILFKIGDFDVTILTLLIAIGGLFIVKTMFSK